jgi:aminopeptidase N
LRSRHCAGFRTRLPWLAMLFVLATPIFATREEHTVDAWQPTNFNVTITLNDSLTEITKARTEITVQVLKDKLTLFDLDFGEMPIDSVTLDGKTAQFDRTPDRLNVHLPKPASKGGHFVIAVDYHGKPKDGLIFRADKDDKPSATGDNWPNRVHNWIPCLDHPSAKATVTFAVTAPARDLVVANGRLDRTRDDSPTTRTWTYTESVPIPAYCMVIAVGEYAKSKPTAPAITPLSFYVPQSDADHAVQGFSAAAPSLKFYREKIAPYPYEKLALIVGATQFGGMENSSAIVFASNVLGARNGTPRMSRAFNIPERLEDVVAHEIAHQWFGDSVTESTWSDLWLSEGFATYFAGLVIEKYDGEEAFRDYMKRAADEYFAYEKKTRTPIHDTETEDLMALLNPNNYQKGAWVLQMLRSQLGDDAFFRGLRLYYNAHKSANATTDDLRAALEKASGKNLKAFFARWVYQTGHPQYELSWGLAEYSGAGGALLVTLKQTQAGEAFLDPVPIDAIIGNAKRRLWIEPTGKTTATSFRFSRGDKPTDVLLDPDNTLLKEVNKIN